MTDTWSKEQIMQKLAADASPHLAAIVDLFRPGVNVTLLVRRPAVPDGSQDFMLTQESNIEDACAALRALQLRPPQEVKG